MVSWEEMTLSKKKSKNALRMTGGDRVFVGSIYFILCVLGIIFLAPMLNVIASSFSSPSAVNMGKVTVFPIDFTLRGYSMVLANKKLVIGYSNTIFYTVFGTVINIVLTILAAYPLSRKDFEARGIMMKIYTFTMYFSGGIIPTYLLYKNMGLIDTRTVMLISSALSIYNLIVMRTFFQTNIPEEIIEATKIDGCSDFRFLVQFVVPLSKAIVAVMVLFYAIGHWNTYFDAYLYLSDEKKYPLSLFFQMLLGGLVTKGQTVDNEALSESQQYKEVIQYALIMVTCVPVWCCCPFLQKYFVQGIMIGSVKG